MSAILGVGNAGTAHERSLPPAMGNYDRRRVNYSLQWRANGDSGGMYGGDSGSAARSALALPMPPSRVVWIARPMKQSCRGVGRVAQNARVRDGELVGVADAQAAFVRAIYWTRTSRSTPGFDFNFELRVSDVGFDETTYRTRP